MVIALDTLVDLLVVDWDNYVETTTDLPDGSYYVKELYVSFPYVLSTDVVEFTLSYNGDGVTPKLVVEGEELVNAPDTGYARFIKLSKSIDDGLVTNGSEYNTEGLDAKAKQIVDEIKSMSREDMLAYFEQAKVKFVEGAEYEIWLDEEGTNKLQEVDLQTGDLKVATFRTDDLGIIELFELPKGAFYLKETKAPAGYEIQNDVVPFEITSSSPEATIYQAIFDESVLVTGLHKTDIYTGKNVPNCKFEIRDEDENLLMYSITDEEGFGYIPQDMFEEGKTYTYTEIEAPEIFDLDTNPHRVYVTGDEMVIDFVNTGDIPVVALAILGVICVAGIAYIVVRKVKASKKA